ncbi:MAG: RluA family pseudouridine synthase [Cellulophaga sp.]
MSSEVSPIRLQEYGVGIFTSISTKSALKKVLKKQFIYVNGKVGSTATIIKGGESIVFYSKEATSKKILKLSLEVVYEDDYLAIVNKPAGILVSGNSFKTVVNALEQNLEKSNQLDAVHPQPVHRLDYPTTGLLLIGKTAESIIRLNKLFESKSVSKVYMAVTIGQMNNKGIIEEVIDGKKAESRFEVMQTVISKRFQFLNLVQLFPKTGRKHQLRKHLASVGNPILGDKEYGIEGLILNGKGMYLHAYSLEFDHPFTNKMIFTKKDIGKKYLKIFSLNT